MACYSNEYKKTCSKIVMAVSVLMGIMSFVTIIFGIIQIGKFPEMNKKAESFNMPGVNAGEGIGKGNIALGVFGLILSVFGCFTGYKKQPCFAIPFGILSFITTILFLVITLFATGMSSQTGQDTLYKLACGGQITINLPNRMDLDRGKKGDDDDDDDDDDKKSFRTKLGLSRQYTNLVDQPTCSAACPCPASARSAFTKDLLSQDQLLAWGRYVSSASNLVGYTALKDTDPKVTAANATALVFAKDDKTVTYDTYQKCYSSVLGTQANNTGKDASDKAKRLARQMAAFVRGNGFEFLSDIETNYDCAGFCKKPLFYVTKPVTERPVKECVRPLVSMAGDFAGVVAIVAGISFVANMCGFCGSFSLCTKMNDDDE